MALLGQSLLALKSLLFHIESLCKQILLFLQVRSLETGGHTGTGVSSGVQHVSPVVVFRLVEQSLDTGLRETPCAGVKRLLLSPYNVFRVRV